MSFLAPVWLLLVPLALLPWVRRADTGPRHARVRSALLVLLAVALARPVITTDEWRVHHAVVIDTTELKIDQVLGRVMDMVAQRGLAVA